jgi:hypothetical protein
MSSGGLVDFLKKTYASADPRSLGIFRVALGALMFFDVLRRYPEVESHYSNAGWISNHFMLFRPMSEHLLSVYLAFSSPNEVHFLMQLHMLACVLFMVGWRTRLMHVVCAILLISLNSRNIMVENGGFVVLTVLAIWTAFLPLGVRFSVDAVRASLRVRREKDAEGLNDPSDPPRPTAPIVTLAVTALLLQWVVIYFFNVVHKNGPEWKDGTAVYYLFHQDRVITGFAAWARELIPLGGYKALTDSGLAIEALVPVLLIAPVRTGAARMIAWALAAVLHLSIAAVVDLGPFSWAMIIMFIVFVPGSVWEAVAKRLDRRYPRSDVHFDATSGFWISVCRVVKRFDVLGHLRFVPWVAPPRPEATPEVKKEQADDEREEDEDDDDDDDEDEESGEGSFAVELAKSRARATEIEAVFALAKCIPGGFFLALPLRLPGIHGFVARRLARASRHAGYYDEYFEVESLPNEPERRAPEPTRARVAIQTTLATLREAGVVLLVVACGMQVLVENAGVPPWLKPKLQPAFLRAMIVYPRMFQGWSMFAPSPSLRDGRLVVDGVTSDGRHLDPLTGEAPVFELAPPSARRMNQIWGDFHRRIGDRHFEPYIEGLKDFIRRHHDVVKKPAEKVVAFEGWYVTETIPAPGEKKAPPERRLLFSEGAMPDAPLGPRRNH